MVNIGSAESGVLSVHDESIKQKGGRGRKGRMGGKGLGRGRKGEARGVTGVQHICCLPYCDTRKPS